MPRAVSVEDAGTVTTKSEKPSHQRLMLAIGCLAIAGILVSSFSLYHHFSTSATSFCSFGESFNCDLVNRSTYSTLFGLPVALLGIVGYSLILALATAYRNKAETPVILLITSLGGLGFSLYLTYVEGFVLHAWCILCLTSLGLISSESVLSGVAVWMLLRRE
jgi:uncharacterized membrane protein